MTNNTTHLEAALFNKAGKKVGTIQLPDTVFAQPWNDSLVHQVVTSIVDNARTPVAHTKDRGEVRGGGRKPWRQKGTGRARHGSRRSPIWIGGGVTHGPRNEKVYVRKINRKMSAAALRAVLSQKLRDGAILFVDSLDLTAPKTALAKTALTALSGIDGFSGLATKKRNAALIATSVDDSATSKSFRNFGNVEVEAVRNLNALQALKATHIIFVNPEPTLTALAGRVGGTSATVEEKTSKVAKKSSARAQSTAKAKN